MYITPYMLGYANWYSDKITREILFFIPFMQVLLIGPVVYFYTKSFLNTGFRLSKSDYFHFVPAVLYGIYSLIVFVTDKLILSDYYFYADGRDKDMDHWYQVMGLVSMAFYLILSLSYYFNYKRLVFDKVSYAETLVFNWIRNFMVAFLGILILRVVFFITNPEWGEFGSQFWHYLAFSFVFFYIGITGYSNIVRQTTLVSATFKVVNVFEDGSDDSGKGLGLVDVEKDVILWKDKLIKLMEERQVYKNPRLTLADVADELDITTKTVSSVVNAGCNMNFNDFVNHHRVEAVKEKLLNGEHKEATLLALALDCGFNSKATFNRAFKKSTSLSPKEYADKLP